MNEKQIWVLIVLILYMVGMVAIGFFFSRKKLNNAQYVLGGRQLNPWVTAMSAQASDMSGWLLTGLPGLAYLTAIGMYNGQEAVYTAIGLLIGTGLNWALTARRLRLYTEISSDSLTVPSYLNNRFKDKRSIIRMIAALIICVFFTVYAASMFSASAKLFNSIFGLEYLVALIISVVIIVAYVMLGGFLAVSWTDMFQGILMFFALLIIPFVCLGNLNETGFADAGELLGKAFSIFDFGDGTEKIGWVTVATGLGWGLGYFGMPHINTRFMAIKSEKEVKPAAIIAMIWVTITLACAIIIGVLGNTIVPGLDDQENVFNKVVMKLFAGPLAGILLAAVLAAIMSTADSQLLVASSSVSNDVYAIIKKYVTKKDCTDKELMIVSRITVGVLAVLGFVFAFDPESSVFDLVSYAWGGLGATFGPIMLFSLYARCLNKYGAISSMIVGAATTIVFKYGLSQLGGFWQIYEIIPGFILATAVLFIVSLLTNKCVPREDKLEMNSEFDEMLRRLRNKEIGVSAPAEETPANEE
ncbi:MAG: sodium/proline symporter PutP [Clostridia bacterium]|nr:sodium/proline symporter PutP [Clostridia bacterium]